MVKLETIQILKYLISNNTKDFTIRELSKVRKINYKSAYQALEKLEKDGSVSINKIGNTKLCKFTKVFTNLVFQAEKERLKDTLKNKDLKVIYEELQKIKSQAIVLLFGSFAKGTQTKNSDIDLLIVSENPNEIEDTISWIPKGIHLTTITYVEFDNMLKSKEFTVVSEAVKNNVILLGSEDYYRFIKNVK